VSGVEQVPAGHIVHFILDAVEQLTDSGFYSDAAVQAVEHNPDGTPTGVTVFAAVEKSDHHKTVADLLPQPEPPAPGPEATPREVMARVRPKWRQPFA